MTMRLAALAIAVLITGCSSLSDNPIYGEKGLIKDRSNEYAKAQPGKRLEIPAGMNSKVTRDGLTVPSVNSATVAEASIVYEVPRPEFFFASEGGDRASIRPLEGEKVILVDESIDQVWQELLVFWNDAEIELQTQDARLGLMETEWIEVDGQELNPFQRVLNTLKFNSDENEPSLNKLRVRVRPDPEQESRTAISMQQVQIPLSVGDRAIDWAADSEELAYSNEIMFSMLNYLSRGDIANRAPTLSGYQSNDKIRADVGVDSRNRPLLSVKASADEAWNLINSALDRAGIDVGTRDQDGGRIYLTYITKAVEEKPKGLLDWLRNRETGPLTFDLINPNRVDEPQKDVSYSSDPNARVGAKPTQEEMLEMEGFKVFVGKRVVYVFGQDNQTQQNAEGDLELIKRYQLAFSRARSGVLISVHDRDGDLVSEDAAQELLWAIKDNLTI